MITVLLGLQTFGGPHDTPFSVVPRRIALSENHWRVASVCVRARLGTANAECLDGFWIEVAPTKESPCEITPNQNARWRMFQ
jgi:hypothetical protein